MFSCAYTRAARGLTILERGDEPGPNVPCTLDISGYIRMTISFYIASSSSGHSSEVDGMPEVF